MSSIVKDELDKIKSFAESTEKRGSKLTLNELNYISDKQLHQKSSGGDSPLGIANIVFHTPNEDTNNIDNYVQFFADGGCAYVPEGEGYPAAALALSNDMLNRAASQWNNKNISVIVPAAFIVDSEYPDLFEIEITGDAEIMPSPEESTSMVYVTGDCTITFVSKQA